MRDAPNFGRKATIDCYIPVEINGIVERCQSFNERANLHFRKSRESRNRNDWKATISERKPGHGLAAMAAVTIDATYRHRRTPRFASALIYPLLIAPSPSPQRTAETAANSRWPVGSPSENKTGPAPRGRGRPWHATLSLHVASRRVVARFQRQLWPTVALVAKHTLKKKRGPGVQALVWRGRKSASAAHSAKPERRVLCSKSLCPRCNLSSLAGEKRRML